MIEAKRLERSCIGIELLPDVAKAAKKLAAKQPPANPDTFTGIIVGDCTAPNTRTKIDTMLNKHAKADVGLIVMHPPYHDIVKFSDNAADLCNTDSVDSFAERFGDAVDNVIDLLADRHYLAVVIGDKYSNSEWVPLGFRLMEEVQRRGAPKRGNRMVLKSIIVKNMVNNRAKRNRENLWRYRAIKGGFYIFRHEYILLFQKRTATT